MSIILDALRKSEAARRRNEAPELFATMPSAAEPARMPPRWPFWTIGTVGTVGIASLALAVWLTTRNEAPSVGDVATASTPALSTYDPSETDTAANVSEDRQAPFPSDAPIPLPANATATTAATRNDIETLAPPPSPATSTPAIEIGPPAAPLAVPSAPQGPNPNGDQRMATEPSSASIVAPPSRTAMAIPSAPAPAPAPVPAPAPAPVAANRAGETAAPDTFRSPRNNAPLAIADLDSGTRQQLPPLKLSMHVWNDVASQRLVILDGQRLREGDALGEVIVERITRDGATLSWRGTALKVEWR